MTRRKSHFYVMPHLSHRYPIFPAGNSLSPPFTLSGSMRSCGFGETIALPTQRARLDSASMAREYKLHRSSEQATSGINYTAELNPQQAAAVTSPPGHALVIAGAGSGKTRTLTYRVAYLLDQGVEPKNILLLTFTNKASREMQERVSELVKRNTDDLWAGTFHSIGNKLLRRHADELGYTRSFSIMDRDDQKALLKTIIKAQKIDTKQRRFPKPDVLASIFSLIENTGASLHDILDASYPYLMDWYDDINRIQTSYHKKKLETNSMDFDDLLLLTLKVLEDNEDLRALYQKKFRHILVDEYQDTNTVQCQLIDILVGDQGSLMVVGDDAQSIYSWRGADMKNILDFPIRYPKANVFKIEQNYRSSPEILALSNEAIKANTEQFHKELKAVRPTEKHLPVLVSIDHPSAQADFLAQRILELRDQGVELEDIAILYRAHYQSMEVQMELTTRSIPFHITSGLRFFEQAHIKDICAWIRFAVNPKDEVSFQRMALLLPGLGPASALKLWESWRASPGYNLESAPKSFSNTLLKFKAPAKAKQHWEQLCHTLDELVTSDDYARPSDMIYSIFHGVYDDYMRGAFDNYDNRRQDIEQLQAYAERYNNVEEFLSQLALLGGVDGMDTTTNKQKQQEEEKGVTLSSIHQAKGLEWKVVFLIWLTDGMFPNARVLESEDLEQLEEERRLFYVAITRAKDQLYMTYPMMNPKSYTGDILQTPSRFLEDCSEELMEEWQVQSW